MQSKIKRVVIYARVSTKEQTVENQLLDLRQYCRSRDGWTIVAEHVDHGMSGSLRERPQLKAMLDFIRKRKADVLLVWRFDRFARSLSHLVSTLEELRTLGIDFVSYQESVDTSTAQGRMVFGVMASLAEFEKELIRERIFAGLRRAKDQGVKFGRPELPAFKVQEILALRGSGSLQQIADRTGVSKTQTWKVLKNTVLLNSPKTVLFLNPPQNVALAIDETPVAQ